MNKPEISEYHRTLAEILKSEPDHVKRKEFLGFERSTDQYKFAKEQAKRKTASLMGSRASEILPEVEDQSYQTEAVVGNPLVQPESIDRELTPQEQTIIWANQVLEEYNGMPKRNSAERKRVRGLALRVARRLVQNPQEIDVAGGVWKSRETNEDEEGGEAKQKTDTFYILVKEEGSKEIKKNWEHVLPEQLAEFVKTYSNSILTQDFAHDMLASYFRGPNNRREKIGAYYNFASSALDVIEDDKALNQALRIGYYDTDILPEKLYLMESQLFYNLPYNEEERVLQKLLIARYVFGGLSMIASEDAKQAYEKYLIYGNNQEFKIAWDRTQERAIKDIGPAEAIRLSSAMNFYDELSAIGVIDEKGVQMVKNTWPGNLVLDEEDPLIKRYSTIAIEKVRYEAFKKYISNSFYEEKMGELSSISIASPDGFIVDIMMPDKLMAERGKVAQYALRRVQEEDMSEVKQDRGILLSGIGIFIDNFEDSQLVVNVRKPAGFESNQHPLQSFETIGFPSPRLDDEEDISLANQRLGDELRASQLRFLNRRGVSVPVDKSALGDYGYSRIDFFKDSDDPEKILARIFVGEIPYSVKLDKNFNFDFEGKRFNAPSIQDQLRFTLLSYLKPILCDERIQSPTGGEGDLNKEITSRMGHLRLLPAGYHRSEQAIINCFSIEGKDLVVQDAERREMRRRSGDPIPDDRDYTYVKPVVEKEENLPPIEVNLPHAVRFRNERTQV